MNDKRLLAIKHGRIMLPLSGLLLVLAIVRINSDELVAQQIFSVGRMLIDFILFLYALDSIVQLTGLCSDRLLLLAPLSRWKLTIDNVLIVGIYLIIAHVIGMIPQCVQDDFTVNTFWFDFVGFLASLVTGLGLMVLITRLVKGMKSRTSMHIGAWVLYLGITSLIVYWCIRIMPVYDIDTLWIIGAVQNSQTCNIYAGIVPITLLDILLPAETHYLFTMMNLGLGIIFWAFAWLLTKKKNNYLEVN